MNVRDRLMALRAEARPAPIARPRGDLRTISRSLPLSARWSSHEMRHLALLVRDPRIAGHAPGDVVFLDLETTGLSSSAGTRAFLVGLAHLDGADLIVEQHLMTDLSREREMLEHVAGRIARAGIVASFNGKSYDVPLLRTRLVLARLEALADRPHADMLHPARRLLRRSLPDVRLQTLERALLGAQREHDIASASIPAAFFEALRTGNHAVLDRIAEHNARDILTLADLVPELVALALGERRAVAADDLAIADHLLRGGELRAAADRASRAVVEPGPRLLRRDRLLSRALRRLRDHSIPCAGGLL